MGIHNDTESMTLQTADGETTLAVNDSVRIVRSPPCWESSAGIPDFADSVELVRRCVGNVYRVDGFDAWGQVEINVLGDGTRARIVPTTPSGWSRRAYAKYFRSREGMKPFRRELMVKHHEP
ncbi:MAG: hypothetical protein H7145_10685 [Akkermansiaceae bacterium]|nr:hypothetical protein [Armatimonadota bacterium]